MRVCVCVCACVRACVCVCEDGLKMCRLKGSYDDVISAADNFLRNGVRVNHKEDYVENSISLGRSILFSLLTLQLTLIYIYIYIYIYISSSYRAGSTDIPDPLSPLLPIVHRPRQVFRTTITACN